MILGDLRQTVSGESPQTSSLGRGVLRFLGSLGKRSEAELYLRIFQGRSPGKFALLVPTFDALKWRGGTLAEQMGFLYELGLVPTVLLGAVDAFDEQALKYFVVALGEVGLTARLHELGADESLDLIVPESERLNLGNNEIRVLVAREPSDELLVTVAKKIAPRKTIFLRREGGLGPHRESQLESSPHHFLQTGHSGIGVINLRTDFENLRASSLLSSEDQKFLSRAQGVLEAPGVENQGATVSVATPLSLLRELFTVSGDGTLIKLGADVDSVTSCGALQREKFGELIEESFGRSLSPAFWNRPLLRVYYESKYRGMALLEPAQHGAFLSKFAVLPVARGEGLAQDLWWEVVKNHPALFFRARPNNPINNWYSSISDGLHRGEEWTIYWRGISLHRIAQVIEDACCRPIDLPMFENI